MPYLTVGEIAKRWRVPPKLISDALYARAVRDDLAPVMSGRRMVHESAVPVLEMVLRRSGKLPANGKAVAHA